MNRSLILLLLIGFSLTNLAQSKPGASRKAASQTVKKGGKGEKSIEDTAWVNPSDTIDWNDYDVKVERRFAVYSKRPGGNDKRMRLCVNIPRDTMLNFCLIDSLCKDPEKFKILFEKKDADTTYILLFIEAFSKAPHKPQCMGGRETKLMFIKWNTVTNKPSVWQRNISSCMRSIENMTRAPIIDWDGQSPLVVNYYKGNNDFVEVKFDPANYKAGLQSATDEK